MINIIVAIGKNGLIGNGNALPWHYSSDLQYFKKITSGHTVFMGQNTYLSIGKPLPNRENVVICAPDFKAPEGVVLVHSLDEFFKLYKDKDVFVMGGRQLYASMLEYADKLYITHVNAEHEGNIFFPEIDYSKFHKVSSTIDGVLEFAVYERIK
ncbi:MAG: dihydrofolate reductase [Bacilli bacterium]|nr:dihydrofolate reductase [Bacilli bacterium]